MASHHIRDEKGDLHIYNDEEYKQYKYNKGCLGVIALLFFVIGGTLGVFKNDKDIPSSSTNDGIVNSEVQNQTKENDNSSDMNMFMNEQTQTEEAEEIETQQPVEETEEISSKQEIIQEGESNDAVTIDESYSENNNESFSNDPKLLKKLQKEERKRQKQLEKEAKRKAKEEAKEAKRKAKEEAKEAKRRAKEEEANLN